MSCARRIVGTRCARHARSAAGARACCATPGSAGVLPEDRADCHVPPLRGRRRHRPGPSVLIRKKIGDNFSRPANYYVDMISSASIDVKLSASPYKETRKQKSARLEYLHGKTTYSAGYIHSVETDYIAEHQPTIRLSQDMFGDLTTVTMSYSRGWDQSTGTSSSATAQIVNDPTFGGTDDGSPIATRRRPRGYRWADPDPDAQPDLEPQLEALTDQGYLQSPYREMRLPRSDPASGYGQPDQIYPEHAHQQRRLRRAEVLPAVPRRARRPVPLLHDTWGIVAPHRASSATRSRLEALDLRRHAALLHAERRRTSTATCSRAPTTRTSWRATASSPRSTATPWASVPRTSSRSRARRGSTRARSTSALDHLLIDYRTFHALLIDPTGRHRRATSRSTASTPTSSSSSSL